MKSLLLKTLFRVLLAIGLYIGGLYVYLCVQRYNLVVPGAIWTSADQDFELEDTFSLDQHWVQNDKDRLPVYEWVVPGWMDFDPANAAHYEQVCYIEPFEKYYVYENIDWEWYRETNGIEDIYEVRDENGDCEGSVIPGYWYRLPDSHTRLENKYIPPSK